MFVGEKEKLGWGQIWGLTEDRAKRLLDSSLQTNLLQWSNWALHTEVQTLTPLPNIPLSVFPSYSHILLTIATRRVCTPSPWHYFNYERGVDIVGKLGNSWSSVEIVLRNVRISEIWNLKRPEELPYPTRAEKNQQTNTETTDSGLECWKFWGQDAMLIPVGVDVTERQMFTQVRRC